MGAAQISLGLTELNTAAVIRTQLGWSWLEAFLQLSALGSWEPGHELRGTEKPQRVSLGAGAVMLCWWCLLSRIHLSI